MLYYLIKYLDKQFYLPGARVINYISFRAGAAALLSLVISIFFGKYFISFLNKRNINEDVRELSLNQNNARKKKTPTMGGIIILLASVIPTLCFAKLTNVYIVLLLISAIWMSVIGFIDDYMKIRKQNKKGITGWFKILGQFSLGIMVGSTLYFHKDVVIREIRKTNHDIVISELENKHKKHFLKNKIEFRDIKSTKTNMPFFKNNELDYEKIITKILPFVSKKYVWIFYVLFVTFIIMSVSNGSNLTDGLDGLNASISAVVVLTLAILAYISGNVVFSQYLNILYIPDLGELSTYCVALAGACVGFLWYNTYPAQIFMGDTGSLMLGTVIAVLAIAIRKELLIPLLCGIYLIEVLSVTFQVLYFKYTKKKYGLGKRIFKMAPLHHHFQQKGVHEAKIVSRFLIIGILLAIFTLVTLKLR